MLCFITLDERQVVAISAKIYFLFALCVCTLENINFLIDFFLPTISMFLNTVRSATHNFKATYAHVVRY